MTIRVVVADDQALVRRGLARMIEAQPDMTVIGEASDGETAVALARELKPDVCLVDIRMPKKNGIEVAQALAGRSVERPIAVVLITTFDLDEYVYRGLRAGARGFLLKDAGTDLIAQAIRAASKGDALIAPSVTARLLEAFAHQSAPVTPHLEPQLSLREEEVLRALAQGQTNSEIGDVLHISLSTVKSHIASLMNKLDARNRVELAMWAYETNRVRR
ncbi:MAG: response regulator transcription factor [Myxococcota bacterium]